MISIQEVEESRAKGLIRQLDKTNDEKAPLCTAPTSKQVGMALIVGVRPGERWQW